jgi:hypothetical protein
MTPIRESRSQATPAPNEIAFDALVESIDEAASPEDTVHDASTAVAEMPAALLESLKSPGLRTAAISPSANGETESKSDERPPLVADLVERLDANEPETLLLETLQLETAVLEVPPLPPPLPDIEIHVYTHEPASGALGVVESEIAQLPRTWKIAGMVVASVIVGGVAALLLLSLLRG